MIYGEEEETTTEPEKKYKAAKPGKSLSQLAGGAGSVSDGVLSAAQRTQQYNREATDGTESSRRYGTDAMRNDGYAQDRDFSYLDDFKLDLRNERN